MQTFAEAYAAGKLPPEMSAAQKARCAAVGQAIAGMNDVLASFAPAIADAASANEPLSKFLKKHGVDSAALPPDAAETWGAAVDRAAAVISNALPHASTDAVHVARSLTLLRQQGAYVLEAARTGSAKMDIITGWIGDVDQHTRRCFVDVVSAIAHDP